MHKKEGVGESGTDGRRRTDRLDVYIFRMYGYVPLYTVRVEVGMKKEEDL